MEFKIIPFERDLLLDWKYDGMEKEISGEQILPVVKFYADLGSCYIGKIGDKILGVGGVYPLWPGAGSAFLFLNREAQNYKKSIFKALLEYMNMLIKKYEIKTLIVECQNDSIQANSLIIHLGFARNRQISMAVYNKQSGA